MAKSPSRQKSQKELADISLVMREGRWRVIGKRKGNRRGASEKTSGGGGGATERSKSLLKRGACAGTKKGRAERQTSLRVLRTITGAREARCERRGFMKGLCA